MDHRALATATGTTHAPVNRVVGGLQFVDATIDGAPCQTRRLGSCRNTTPSERQSFIGREQAPTAFIEERGGQLPPQPDFINVNHGFRLPSGDRVAPTQFAILILRFQGVVDSIILPQALTPSWDQRTDALEAELGR
jgi:hypothetical protein